MSSLGNAFLVQDILRVKDDHFRVNTLRNSRAMNVDNIFDVLVNC